jgi:hypothetical protein
MCDLGRLREAEELSRQVRDQSPSHDRVNFLLVDGIDGYLLASAGRVPEGLQLVRGAVEQSDSGDFYSSRYLARFLAAMAYQVGDRPDVAETLAREAVEIALAKGDVMAAQRARERLSDVGVEVP